MIDTHVHSWVPGGGVSYPWMSQLPDDQVTAAHTVDELDLPAAHVQAVVLVQAADSLAETDFLLTLAARQRVPARVVGWLPLADPATLEQLLPRYCQHRLLVGVRHLIHDDPDPRWLLRPEVSAGLSQLGAAGLVFDLVANRLDLLELVPDVATQHPQTTFVLDHLGKPPSGQGFPRWCALMERIANCANVLTKISGLTARSAHPADCAASWQRPVTFVLEHFGPDRLMVGSDWPISLAERSFAHTHTALGHLLADLPADAAASLAHGTAKRVYRF